MHFLELIAKECEGIFKTGDDILVFGLNVMQESGTIIYILDLKSEKGKDGGVIETELKQTKYDIVLNEDYF